MKNNDTQENKDPNAVALSSVPDRNTAARDSGRQPELSSRPRSKTPVDHH